MTLEIFITDKYIFYHIINIIKKIMETEGLFTTIWGPAQWHFLHTISFNYPSEPTVQDKKNYRNYVLSLIHILPCKYCRMNLKTNLKQMPLKMEYLKNRETFSRYIYDLHELVNKMLKKKSNLSYCDVRERYEHFRARCVDKKPKVFYKPVKYPDIKTKKNKEKGCTEPLYGKKARCILNIVPQDEKGQSIQIDKKCMKRRE
jgi:hypothetical protein